MEIWECLEVVVKVKIVCGMCGRGDRDRMERLVQQPTRKLFHCATPRLLLPLHNILTLATPVMMPVYKGFINYIIGRYVTGKVKG